MWQVVSVIGEERAGLAEVLCLLTPRGTVRMAPFEFVKILHDEAYLDLVQDPEALVDFFLGGEKRKVQKI